MRYQASLPGMETAIQLKPFLRWAGGKSRLTGYFRKYVPNEFGRYWEPFLGSGALYFSLVPRSAYLSDSNADLISCFKSVRDNPEQISIYLREHAKKTSENYYYKIRNIYNNSHPSIAQAARFIYLNKTSFNGIFRVNIHGEYNVPYGHKEPPALPSLTTLTAASNLLKHADLETHSFEKLVDNRKVTKGDFIYFDPPYPPMNGTSNFTHYTAERFSWEDQKRVAEVATWLSKKGCLVMVSNSELPQIRELYKNLYEGWKFSVLPVVRWIAANGSRHKVNELVITNYPILEEHK